ncbi:MULTISPECIES: prepilin-type N-terminal cleavage/methylation domain-containing protein [unclassified Pseudomonas]|uniref:type IV pilus modification PilV family protein n=1 Tax=unclassified Pseudomonas TaxID=196821 RepID=UPI0038054CE7
MHARQRGMTLLEVLLAVAVIAFGMFAAAALQIQALQATEAAHREVQVALAAHTLHERAGSAGKLTVRQP